MFSQFKLLHKQLAIVGAVLFSELVLIGTLQILLTQVENEAERSARAYQVSAEANLLVKQCSDTTSALILWGVTKSDEFERRYETLAEGIPEKIKSLDQLSSEFNEDQESMLGVVSAAKNWSKLLSNVRSIMSMRGQDGFTLALTTYLNREGKPHIRELTGSLVNLSEHHKLVEAAQAEKVKRSKSLLELIMIVGGIMQVVIAAMTMFFFSRSITGRLAVLTDNTLRLGRNLPLLKPIDGVDEIAQLDKFFHEMATALESASLKERAIVDGMPVGFITLRADGFILTVNPRALSMIKASSDQLTGKPLSDFVRAPDDSKLSFQKIKELAHGRSSEMQFLRIDGTWFPAEVLINPIEESNPEVLICNILDVTERHEVDRLKREFVSIVSHDLKTPLTAIQGSFYLLSNGNLGTLTERGRKVVEGSQMETQRLVRLVSDLLDVARIEAGRIELERAQVETDSIVTRSVNAVVALAEEKNVTIDVDAAHLNASIFADADRLVQVLVNLLSNAIKYSPPESTIKILCQEAGDEFEFRVTDRGPGIPQASQQKVFERFVQVSREDRTEKGGTGLGLAICKLIVEAHGGKIGVDSADAQGSSFWFKVPCSVQVI